jgi:hypothetical protein
LSSSDSSSELYIYICKHQTVRRDLSTIKYTDLGRSEDCGIIISRNAPCLPCSLMELGSSEDGSQPISNCVLWELDFAPSSASILECELKYVERTCYDPVRTLAQLPPPVVISRLPIPTACSRLQLRAQRASRIPVPSLYPTLRSVPDVGDTHTTDPPTTSAPPGPRVLPTWFARPYLS